MTEIELRLIGVEMKSHPFWELIFRTNAINTSEVTIAVHYNDPFARYFGDGKGKVDFSKRAYIVVKDD